MNMNEREAFWKGEFGNEYVARSPGDETANYALFKRALFGYQISSAIELGAGSGANLRALRRTRIGAELAAVEINEIAISKLPLDVEVFHRSVLEWGPERTWDLAFTKGLLIHIHPHDLPRAYEALVRASQRYVLVAEYYSPNPVEIPYRGHAGRLWKRDFAGELIDQHGLKLVDYGFVYHRDQHPQDDISWFLMEKPFEPA